MSIDKPPNTPGEAMPYPAPPGTAHPENGSPQRPEHYGSDRQAAVEELTVELDGQDLDTDSVVKLAVNEQRYGFFGLCLGVLIILAGAAMIVFTDSTGAVELTVQIGDAKVQLIPSCWGSYLQSSESSSYESRAQILRSREQSGDV